MSELNDTSSMLCGMPSPDRSISDLSVSDITGECQKRSSDSTSKSLFASIDGSIVDVVKLEDCDGSLLLDERICMHSSCDLHGTSTMETNETGSSSFSVTIIEKMARLTLDDGRPPNAVKPDPELSVEPDPNAIEPDPELGVEPDPNAVEPDPEVSVLDPDLELATNELSFNISDEIARIYHRIRKEAVKSSSTLLGTGTTTISTETSKSDDAKSKTHDGLETKTNADVNPARASSTSQGSERFSRSSSTRTATGKLSNNSSVLSEFAPMIMSTPNYERNNDSVGVMADFTFQPWRNDHDKKDVNVSMIDDTNIWMLSNDSSTMNDQAPSDVCDESWLSSSLVQQEVRLAHANRITNSTMSNNYGNESTKCYSLSTPGDSLNRQKSQQIGSSLEVSEFSRRSASLKSCAGVISVSDIGSTYRSAEGGFRSAKESAGSINQTSRSRNISYHRSIPTNAHSDQTYNKSNVDPFTRYIKEKKQAIDAINEMSEYEDGESQENFESAIITQDSIRVQMGSQMQSSGWLRRRIELDSQSASIHSLGSNTLKVKSRKEFSQKSGFGTIMFHEEGDVPQDGSLSLYQPRLLRTLSQSNINSLTSGTSFRSINEESSHLMDRQSVGDHEKVSRNCSSKSNGSHKQRSARRRSKSCNICQTDPVFDHSNILSFDVTRNRNMNDSTEFVYGLKAEDIGLQQNIKPDKFEWRNGKYFSDKWERFVSRKLLFDISKRFGDLEDADFDVFIPDDVLDKVNGKELIETREAVKRAVRHIHDDPRMAQILLNYTGDINDVSAARRHYIAAINEDTAFADLTKSFNSALDHFLSFSIEPSQEEDDYHSIIVEKKPEKKRRGRQHKNSQNAF